MKKLLILVAACAISTPAFAQMGSRGGQVVSRGGIVNSATVNQTAGAFAFSQVGQGERVLLDSPRHGALVAIDSGAFLMPYVNDSFNASRGGDLRVYDPVGSYFNADVDVSVDANPIP
jgi:hypothetical protein